MSIAEKAGLIFMIFNLFLVDRFIERREKGVSMFYFLCALISGLVFIFAGGGE